MACPEKVAADVPSGTTYLRTFVLARSMPLSGMSSSNPLSLSSHASLLWRMSTAFLLLTTMMTLTAAEAPQAPTASTNAQSPLFTEQEWNHVTNKASSGQGFESGPALASIVISLVVVAGLAILLGVLVKRFGMRRIMPGRGRHLEVVEHLAVGYKRTVSLVRIGDQVLVLGQGEHDLTHLATLPASILDQVKTVAEALPADSLTPSKTASVGSFRTALDKVLGRTP
jgi:flagellar biosynthetic protein FliO